MSVTSTINIIEWRSGACVIIDPIVSITTRHPLTSLREKLPCRCNI